MPVYDDPPVPHDGGHVVPGHLDWARGAEVSWDEDPVSGVRAATDLHPREVNHRPLGAEGHRGRGVRVRDADIERPGAEVDIKIPESVRELQPCSYWGKCKPGVRRNCIASDNSGKIEDHIHNVKHLGHFLWSQNIELV